MADNKRLADDIKATSIRSTAELICNSCRFKTGKVATCKEYPYGKPTAVFDGDCSKFEEETSE